MQNVKAVLLASIFCIASLGYANATDNTAQLISISKKAYELHKKQNPSLAKAFSLSAENNFKDELSIANRFYDSLAKDDQATGFGLLYAKSKSGVTLERYSKKVRNAYQFFGKPGDEKKLIQFSLGQQTQWFFYKIPIATITFNTRLLSKDKSYELNGFVKIILIKKDRDTPPKVMSFVIIPGKINTPRNKQK